MLHLITAVPGSGKSLFAVQKILSYLEENKKLVALGQQPRPIFSNIDGLKVDGVLDAPKDWTTCPDGSVVFYDECQQMFPPDKQGRSDRHDIAELETHRHRGFDIWMITQHPKLLHSHIRRLVGKHYHLERQYGHDASKVFQKDGQLDVDKSTTLRNADHYLWMFPKELYGLYDSAVVHTHKRALPRWLIRSVVFGSLALLIFFVLLKFAWGFFTGKDIADKIQGTVDKTSPIAGLHVPEGATIQPAPAPLKPSLSQIAASAPVNCISSADHCACYTQGGVLVEQSPKECKASIDAIPTALISPQSGYGQPLRLNQPPA